MNDFFTSDGDFYQILEIEKTATKEDIKKAFRRLALIWHPDKHTVENQAAANKKFILLKKAYDALIDDHSRILHDMMGPKAFGKQSAPFQSPWGERSEYTEQEGPQIFGPTRGNTTFTFLDEAFDNDMPSTMYGDVFGGDDLFLRRKYYENVYTNQNVNENTNENTNQNTSDNVHEMAH